MKILKVLFIIILILIVLNAVCEIATYYMEVTQADDEVLSEGDLEEINESVESEDYNKDENPDNE